MPRTAANAEQLLPLAFPTQGIDHSSPFETQTPFTAAAGLNCRAFEALTRRGRGGSRTGLAKYIPDPVSALNQRVQCLDILIDPTTASLIGAADVFDIPGFNDPVNGIADPSTNNNADGRGTRNPGRIVRTGGSGQQPNRHAPTPLAVADALTTTIGAVASTVNVLSNDSYSGVPTITITTGPSLPGATAVVTGTGAASRIVYTSPGTPGTDTVTYRLKATGDFGSSLGKLTVTVVTDPHVGSVYSLSIAGTFSSDIPQTGWLTGTVAIWNGVVNQSLGRLYFWAAADGPPYTVASAPPPTLGTIIISDADSAFLFANPGAHAATMTLTGLDGSGAYNASLSFP